MSVYEAPRKTGWDWCHQKPEQCIVCGQSTVLTFNSGCLLYKQEIIFLFVDIQKKAWGSQGERERIDTRDCVRVKHIKSEKWGAVRRKETVGEILAPDIFPVLLKGCIYFVHFVYLSFSVRKTFLILLLHWMLFLPPRSIWHTFLSL